MSKNNNETSNITNRRKINNDKNNKSKLFHDISLIQEQENAKNKNNELKNNFEYLFASMKKYKSNPNIFHNKNNKIDDNNDDINNKLKSYLEKFKNKIHNENSENKYNPNLNILKKGLLIDDSNALSHRSNYILFNKKNKDLVFDEIFNDNIINFDKMFHNNHVFFSKSNNLFQRIRKIRHDMHLLNFSEFNNNLTNKMNNNNLLNNINKKHKRKLFDFINSSIEKLKKKDNKKQKTKKHEILINGYNTERYINKYKNELKNKYSSRLFNKIYQNNNSKNNILDFFPQKENMKLNKLLNNIPTRRKFREKSIDVINNISAIYKTKRNYKKINFREEIENNSNLIINLYNNRFNCVYPSNDYDIIKQQTNMLYYKH